MAEERVFQIDIYDEVDKYFDDSSIPTNGQPEAVIFAGGVCAGKTTLRQQTCSKGYVLIDAGEIFLSLSNGEYFDFGTIFEEHLKIIGSIVASKAIIERRNIVTEIIGASFENTKALIDAIRAAGYKVQFRGVTCDVEEAVKRNANRGNDNISAHYTEPYHLRWILGATAEYRKAGPSKD